MSTASAPLEIGQVALTVNDIDKVGNFYSEVLGLERLSGDREVSIWGAGNTPLLELRADRAARPRSPREAGLFHTAFLLPTRSDLADWLIYSADTRVQLQGAYDHLVSEAIYFADPEGNGIEIYADRPRTAWHDAVGNIKMASDTLDLTALALSAKSLWTAAPERLVVGHVHLQVGNLPAAETFYHGILGMPVSTRSPGATFYGSGSYHHHIATNTWKSRNAAPRSFPATGLAELRLRADATEYDAIIERAGSNRLSDPWGTPVTINRKAA